MCKNTSKGKMCENEEPESVFAMHFQNCDKSSLTKRGLSHGHSNIKHETLSKRTANPRARRGSTGRVCFEFWLKGSLRPYESLKRVKSSHSSYKWIYVIRNTERFVISTQTPTFRHSLLHPEVLEPYLVFMARALAIFRQAFQRLVDESHIPLIDVKPQ